MLTIKVEAMVGSDILTTCTEMVRLANKSETYIECNFNGVTLFTKPKGVPQKGVELYHKELSNKNEVKLACF